MEKSREFILSFMAPGYCPIIVRYGLATRQKNKAFIIPALINLIKQYVAATKENIIVAIQRQ
ncbi:hypothetical protein [Nitrosospira briensis]|uniref:hypothetical protein n=1 Tax=Nitrosospira briensis TaxID=35799 RepID=UPI0012E16F8E|nr:hypothetical protein [Nitrosospira briensis]